MDFATQRVTLKMLRYFYQVAHTENFSLAAQQLNITKSPLSAQIRELEQLMEVELFLRDTRNVQLTPAGKQLQKECRLIFDVLDTSISRVKQRYRVDHQTINIGLMSSIFWAGFGDALYQLQQRYPATKYNLIEMSPEKQKLALEQGRIDIGLVRYADTVNVAPLTMTSLYREKMMVALPEHHPLANHKLLSLNHLSEQEFVMLSRENSSSTDWIIQRCQQSGFHPNIVQQVVEPNTLLAVISTRCILSIVPESYASLAWPHVRFIPLREMIAADICALTVQDTPLLRPTLNELKQALQ